MAGGGSSSSTSKPVDMTPQAFKNLQQPFANVVASLLGFSPVPGSGTSAGSTSGTPGQTPQGTPGAGGTPPFGPYGGDTDNTPHGGAPNSAYYPSNLGNGGGTQGQNGTSGAGTPGAPNYTGGPNFTDPNSVLSGIPGYNGQVSAPITGNESNLLSQLMGTSGLNDTARSALNGILSGNGAGVPGVTAATIDPAAVASGFSATTDNPLLQAYITAAQRSTMDNLAHTLVSNGSNFTANGQFVQPGGSSAFDRAQALATQSAANAMGDIASNIGYQGYELNQQLNQQTQQANAANALQALLGNQSSGLTAQQSNQSAGLQEQQNVTSAANAQGNLSSSEVSSLVSNLQAQALPRLIEQYGLDQGLQMFNNQVNDLLTILQTGAGVTSPVIANESKSSSTQKPSLL